MSDKKIKTIEEILKKLLKLLEVPIKYKIEKEEETYLVNIEAEEAGILIGSYGETLRSLKHFLTLALFKKFGEWVSVSVDVNDYLKKREQELCQMAKRAAERVVITGEPVTLSYLNSAERRIIHLALSSHSQVCSESEGEGRMRRLIVKPRA